ncbi:class I SAM-dependent methyltransferase [Halomonas sp. DQ26W]|uniref:class I SAM-dependent methyltransferase n=1 Tax=Halomonas sp. DQ26W TaxID=2282311 RepID=UPI000DF80F42|nr:class I SAM-dependent methyltransferase [Halomonas sp. DQ26W]RDB43071.1 class I SAM-dependent methyltransferase [Halomonas sp. DQ26W]
MPSAQFDVAFDHVRQLNDHYDAATTSEGQPLRVRLKKAFLAVGCDPDSLNLDDLAGIDQLHLGGRSASRALAAMGELNGGERVLDVGCGTGGASRLLAAEYDCDVVGVDITSAFVEVATWLSKAAGLDARTRFLKADAAVVPLESDSFDVIWCQHALMNMPDAHRVLAEWRRLLSPGGRVLIHEVVAGDNREPLAFPVPWARTAGTSHLRDGEQLQRLFALAGFELDALEDVTESALAWRRERSRRESAGESAPGPVVSLPGPEQIFGEVFFTMGRNLRDNLAAGKVRILEAVWRLN